MAPLRSQPIDLKEIQFRHIKEGLSQSSVTNVLQDKFGYFWIGTPSGLNKYDGRSFEIFESDNNDSLGLSNSYIETLFEDESGVIWIGTNQGLNFYNRAYNRVDRFMLNGERLPILDDHFINCITKINESLWLGTAHGGVVEINLESSQIIQVQLPEVDIEANNENFISGLIPWKSDVIAFTPGGVYVVNTLTKKVLSVNREIKNVSHAYKDDKGGIWAGTFDGHLIQLEYDESEQSIKHQSFSISAGHSILSIQNAPDGSLWIGTENAGLAIFSPATGEVKFLLHKENDPLSVGSNSIWSIYLAKNDVMWVGTYSQGMCFYDPDYFKFRHIRGSPQKENTLSHGNVSSFLEDPSGNLWIGTDGGGLNYWNRVTNEFTHHNTSDPFNPLSSNAVLSLIYDFEGNLWCGTWSGGINIIDKETGKITNLRSENSFISSDNIYSLITDKKNRIWAASFLGGVDYYDPKSKTSGHIQLKSSLYQYRTAINISTLLEDSDQNIWVGTQNDGVFKITPTEDDFKIKHYGASGEDGALNSNFIYTIFEDSLTGIWIGTPSGLHHFIKGEERFEIFTKREGLVDDAIKGILKDQQGYFWLSTNKGLMKFDYQNGTTQPYDVSDGLQSNEFFADAAYTTRNGELIFGGINGFNIFKSKEIKLNQELPTVYFSNLRIFNKPVNVVTSLVCLKRTSARQRN